MKPQMGICLKKLQNYLLRRTINLAVAATSL